MDRFRLRPYQVIVGGFLLLILLGACLLSLPFASRAPGSVPFGDCLFTATSAVCVTGLIVRDTATTWTLFGQGVLLVLIQIGGMGVVTMALMLSFFSGRKIGLMQRVLMRETISAPQVGGIVRLTRFILISTAAIEGAGERVLPALFRSVTLRTAGFNSADLGSFSDTGKVTMILWMLVGGSPGSTAGGLKTTTLAVLYLALWAVVRRRENTEAFGRRFPEETARSAIALLVLYLTLFISTGMLISRVEGLPLLTCLFETASAVGTVGVTLGITPSLGPLSRALLMGLMFFGRAGALTLIYAAQPFRPTGVGKLPEEKITVG